MSVARLHVHVTVMVPLLHVHAALHSHATWLHRYNIRLHMRATWRLRLAGHHMATYWAR
jgi:hypothetical protein